jgi:hypothetical protein
VKGEEIIEAVKRLVGEFGIYKDKPTKDGLILIAHSLSELDSLSSRLERKIGEERSRDLRIGLEHIRDAAIESLTRVEADNAPALGRGKAQHYQTKNGLEYALRVDKHQRLIVDVASEGSTKGEIVSFVMADLKDASQRNQIESKLAALEALSNSASKTDLFKSAGVIDTESQSWRQFMVISNMRLAGGENFEIRGGSLAGLDMSNATLIGVRLFKTDLSHCKADNLMMIEALVENCRGHDLKSNGIVSMSKERAVTEQLLSPKEAQSVQNWNGGGFLRNTFAHGNFGQLEFKDSLFKGNYLNRIHFELNHDELAEEPSLFTKIIGRRLATLSISLREDARPLFGSSSRCHGNLARHGYISSGSRAYEHGKVKILEKRATNPRLEAKAKTSEMLLNQMFDQAGDQDRWIPLSNEAHGASAADAKPMLNPLHRAEYVLASEDGKTGLCIAYVDSLTAKAQKDKRQIKSELIPVQYDEDLKRWKVAEGLEIPPALKPKQGLHHEHEALLVSFYRGEFSLQPPPKKVERHAK